MSTDDRTPGGGGWFGDRADEFDEDIWSSDDQPADPSPGPRRPPSSRIRRPGRPGAVPTEPVTGQVPQTVIEPAQAQDRGYGEHGYDEHGYDELGYVEHEHQAYDEYDQHDYEELRPERGVSRWVAVLVAVALLAGVVFFGANWWYQRQVDPPGAPGEAVSVVVPEGASTSRIADLLASQGVVSNGFLFNYWLGGKDTSSLQAGTYQLQKNSSFEEALEGLRRGPGAPVVRDTTKVTIPEGLRVDQILTRISEAMPRLTVADLQAALAAGEVTSEIKPADLPGALEPTAVTSWEGLLFPATYDFDDEATAADVLNRLSIEMTDRVGLARLEEAATRINASYGLDLTPYQILVVASMVQREAGNADEAPKIATVIYNRLAKPMALGIDATSQYLAAVTGEKMNFDSTSPYNTRTQAGLPPTAIGVPSAYALDAATNPAEGDWLYYVLTDVNVHSFSVGYDEFLANKKICVEKDLGCA